MTCGIKKPSRAFRISAGVIIVTLGLIFQSYWGLLGLVPIVFGALNYCPLCNVKHYIVKWRN
ncbi:DUF2892 domain-containing protein [Sulfurospirillum sp. T05]|uniref:DUF2892 domain-containing protein n=1 Tax=Sulfurospirillum tamanense TaxID=2813362 RepID=A0ABS2WNX7_9BACT|nr:DUF2892 domain-containing protein [Sulfurospirillum tamanensis]MBN2963325.1 DUF2892 domain-containing protein [Sulfurospirillum tamanensis]